MGWGSREKRIVARVFGLNSRASYVAAIVAVVAASSAVAQQDSGTPAPSTAASTTKALRLPENPQVFVRPIPSVVKATAIVSGDVITQTDLHQRVALPAIANGGHVAPNELDSL